MAKKIKFLEDVAISDIAFEARGKDLSELFSACADAVFQTMADIKTINPVEKRKITIYNEKIDGLLYDFLSEIVYLKDRDGLVFRESVISVEPNKHCFYLIAEIFGEKINPKKQTLRADVKAVTMHMFTVTKLAKNKGYKAIVVLDV